MNHLKSFLAEVLRSKKAIAFLSGIAVLAASKHGMDIDPDTVNKVLAMVGSYVVGQGIADIGKERAKVEAASAAEAKKTESYISVLLASSNDPENKKKNEEWARAQLAEALGKK
jgi:hypothetical protein